MDSAGLRDFYAMFSIAVFAISIYAASRFYYASARRTGLDRELFRALLAVMTIGIANAAWDVVRFTGLVAISDPELDRLPARVLILLFFVGMYYVANVAEKISQRGQQ